MFNRFISWLISLLGAPARPSPAPTPRRPVAREQPKRTVEGLRAKAAREGRLCSIRYSHVGRRPDGSRGYTAIPGGPIDTNDPKGVIA